MQSTVSKITAALCLAAWMLTALSCGSSENTPLTSVPEETDAGDTSALSEGVSDTAEVTESDRPALDLPDADYKGYKFRVLEYDLEDSTYVQFSDFWWTKDSAGELINDAVYARNLMIEERYNCTVDVTFETDTVAKAKASITAGSDDYDIAELFINNVLALAPEGMFYNFYDVPHISLDKDWWDQAIQRDIALLGRIYVMTGDISMQDEELNYCVYFNKTVAKNYDLPDLYQIVRDGKWTLDTFYEDSKQVSRDLNGDGVRDENDAYGILTDGGMLWLYYFTCGGTYAELDKDGNPYFTIGSARNLQVLDDLVVFLRDKDTIMWASDCSEDWTTLNQILMEDRALFRPGSIYDITKYRNMITDFGVLPYPKYDENQDSYYHPVASHVCPALCIPTTNTDLDRTGLLLEALAYESRDTVTKAYYDVNLHTKLTRDNDSGEMLDIIFATKRYDICKVFNWGSVDGVLGTLASGNKSMSGLWAAREDKAIAAMEKTIAYFSSEE